MKEIVIVGAARTPIGTFGGALRDMKAIELSRFIIESVIAQTGIEKNMVEQVIMGNCFEPIDHNIARIGLVNAGLPIETTAFHVGERAAPVCRPSYRVFRASVMIMRMSS